MKIIGKLAKSVKDAKNRVVNGYNSVENKEVTISLSIPKITLPKVEKPDVQIAAAIGKGIHKAKNTLVTALNNTSLQGVKKVITKLKDDFNEGFNGQATS